MTTNQGRTHPANRIRRAGILIAAAVALGGSAFGVPSAIGEGRELDMGVYEECMSKGGSLNPHDNIALCCINAGGDPVFAPGTDVQIDCAAPVPEAEPFNPQQPGPIVIPSEVADPVVPNPGKPKLPPRIPLAPVAPAVG